MAKPSVLVIAGHRYFEEEGSNPTEFARTPALARAYRDAIRSSGCLCEWLQEVDGDTDPDFTNGTRADNGRLAGEWIAAHPGWVVVLDLHYESGGGARGVFAIVPNRDGLMTTATVPQGPHDHWEFNTLDRKLGREIVNRIATATGLPQRTVNVRETGLMDEVQTGVGADGWRLAILGWTSPHYDRTLRLVIEHGALDSAADWAIIRRSGFAEKCANAAAAAIGVLFPE